MKKVTEQKLVDVSLKGKYLVVELLADHHQKNCSTVPAGTRGVITATRDGEAVFVFPHTILNSSIKSFSDGDVRIIPSLSWKAIGRIDL